MQVSFLNHTKPLLTNMIQVTNPEDCIITAKNAIYDGADAFGFQICRFDPKYRTQEIFKRMFAAMGYRPIYITNYRQSFNENMTDEERMDGLLDGLRAGATLGDIMGDTFDPSPMELTRKPSAVDMQKRLIDKIHGMGKEVLMSSHIYKFLPAEQVLEIAYAQQERGADIVKIVTGGASEEEELENLRITAMLKKELKVPYLFLSTGTHYKLHRMIGPMLGCVMYLCVQQHDALSSKSQPILKSVRSVFENIDYMPDIEAE